MKPAKHSMKPFKHFINQVASSSGAWKAATFPLSGGNGNSARPALEFVISNLNGSEWDKTSEGEHLKSKVHMGRWTFLHISSADDVSMVPQAETMFSASVGATV